MNMRVGRESQSNFDGVAGSPETVTIPVGFQPGTRDTQGTARDEVINKFLENLAAGKPVLTPPMVDIDPVKFLSSITNFLQLKGEEPGLFSKTNGKSSGNGSGAGGGNIADEQRAEYSKAFAEALMEYGKDNKLSPSDLQKLQFAFFNPEAGITGKASDGTPLAEIYNTIIGSTQEICLANGVDVSKLNPPIDNRAFNLNISDSYNISFEKLVDQDPALTMAQKGQILFMHYNPGIPMPNSDPKILSALKNFEAQALTQTQQKYGISADWKPPLNSELYNSVLKSQFEVNLQVILNDYSSYHNVSSEDVALIKKAIENPNAKVPDNIKAAAQEILNKAIQDTKVQNNLPIDWQPSDLSNIFSNIANNKTTLAFINGREMINNTIKTLNLIMPDGPQKVRTLDLLQSVSAAIILMQKTIYEVEQAHSQVAQNEALAKKGAQDLQIRLQEAQNKEIASQLQKQQSMGAAMAILGPIMKVFEFLMTLASGGALAAVFAILDSQFNFMQQGIESVMKGVAEMVDKMIPNDTGNPDIDRLKFGIKSMSKIMTIVAMAYVASSAAGSMLMNALGPQQVINISIKVVTESGIVTDFCQMVGIPKKEAEYVSMAVGIAMTLAIAIVSCVNPAAGVARVAAVAGDIAKVAMQVTSKVAQVIQKVVNFIKSIEILNKIMNAVQPAISAITQAIRAATQAAGQAANSIANIVGKTVKNVLNSVLNFLKRFETMEKLMNGINKLVQQIIDNPNLINRAMRAVNLTQAALGATASGIQGGIAISQAKVALSKAKYESEIAEVQQMIKMLQKMIDALLDGLSGFGDQLNELKGLFDNLIGGLSQTLQKTTSIHA